jgi:hypothetical protein
MERRATENRASESAGADSGFGRSPRNQRKRFAHEVRGEASIAFHAMEKRFSGSFIHRGHRDLTALHLPGAMTPDAIALTTNPTTGTVWAGVAGQDSLPSGHPYEFSTG